MRVSAIVILLMCSAAGVGQTDAPVSETQIKQWVEQLSSPRFVVRETATENLMRAGPDAIEVLIESITVGGVETSLRGLKVLRELSLRDDGDAIPAEDALRRLASGGATATSQRAATVLNSLNSIRTDRGLKIIRRLGATISFSGITFEEKSLPPNTIFISLSNTWKGTTEDLAFLSWLADYDGVHLTLQGPQFDDQWVEHVSALQNVIGLQLNRAGTTDEGLRYLKKLESLRLISIRYCRMSDACLKYIEDTSDSLESLSVFGGNISKSAFDQLAAKHRGWNTRYGRGGFLGIGGSAFWKNGVAIGCLVSSVTENSAARIAGIREFDIITAFNGQPVTQFVPSDRVLLPEPQNKDQPPPPPSLSELIGEHAPGDRVTFTILRGNTEMQKQVVLGEWP